MLSLKNTHPEWQDLLKTALQKMDPAYLETISKQSDWLPGSDSLFKAFQLPLSETRYILFGESPYPRKESANGFAFWDGAVGNLWSESGLSKEVNRATSLRNFLKMLLLARGDLGKDSSQGSIAVIDKSNLIRTASELFNNMMHHGILLLNATLLYREKEVAFHARKWEPFMQSLQESLVLKKPAIQRILLGKIAEKIPDSPLAICLKAEHPYNLSFINNPEVVSFFQPLDLLRKYDYRIQY